MRKQIIENAAYNVATQVRAVEDSIDNALAELAELQARMVRASGVMPIGPATGQVAFEHLGSAIQNLITVRGTVAVCHGELASAKQTVPGLRTVAFGEPNECPPLEAVRQADLRVVA